MKENQISGIETNQFFKLERALTRAYAKLVHLGLKYKFKFMWNMVFTNTALELNVNIFS